MSKEKVGLYPGSFNPWHDGHSDIILKALNIFDKIVVAQAYNPDKEIDFKEASTRFTCLKGTLFELCQDHKIDASRLWAVHEDRTLLGMLKNGFIGFPSKPQAVIRGLRNGHDLQYEMNQQYWNEDVGVEVPFAYFITDRKLSHVSSSAIRQVQSLGLDPKYVR